MKGGVKVNQADWIRKRARNAGRGCVLLPLSLILFLMGCSVSRIYTSSLESKAKRIGLTEHQVQLGAANVHYWIGGKGPPLLVLHGFGGDSLRTWASQIRALAQHHTLILPDMVFFGQSSASSSPSLSLQSETFLKLIQHAGLGPADVMGISYGGFVTLQMKRDNPDLVRRVIVVDSPGGHFDEADEAALLDRFDAESPAEIFIPQDWRGVRQIMQLVFYRPPWLPIWVYRDVKEVVFSANHAEQLVLLGELRGRRSEFMDQDWSETEALVVWGAEDPVFPVALGEQLSQSLGAEFVVFEEAAHGPNLEHPRRFNRLVLQWLKDGTVLD
jgi:pimeloyl-ACP methyl ester carboxylesterase